MTISPTKIDKNNTPIPDRFKMESDLNTIPVDMKTKIKILDWLIEIKLVKEGVANVSCLHLYCMNGVLLFDLVNVVKGTRNPVIRGV